MRRVGVVVLVVIVVVAGAAYGIAHLLSATSAAPSCRVDSTDSGFVLEPRQAANATTIAAVGRREQLPNHAVTIALAAALQESKLRNLDYGDRDSLGLFQQRPSQGWGTPAQLLQPAYAAGEFFSHLERVSGWRTLPVAEAAQRVQHSADGSAYARWEDEARALARALTGEVVAGISCHFTGPSVPHRDELAAAVSADLGSNGLHSTENLAHDWSVASWLVAHAYAFGVRTISLDGRTWTSASGAWQQDPSAGDALTYRFGAGARR